MIFRSILFSSLFLLSCSLKINEKPRASQKVVSDKMTCVQGLGVSFKKYLASKLTNSEIDNWTDCLIEAIENFEKFTVGEVKDRYSAKEIVKSVSDVVYSGDVISSSQTDDIMEIKKLIIGGSKEWITRSELTEVKSILRVLSQSAKEINPYLKFLLFPEEFTPDEVKIDQTIRVFKQQIQILKTQIRVNNEFIEFKKVREIILNYKPAIRSESEDVSNFIALLNSAYNLLLAKDIENTRLHNKHLFDYASDLLSWYQVRLLYKNSVEKIHILEGERPEVIGHYFELVIRNLDKLYLQHEKLGHIDFLYFDRLIESLDKNNLIPKPFSMSSIKSILRPLVNKVFIGTSNNYSSKKKHPGISFETIRTLEREFNNWFEVQTFLVKYFRSFSSGKDLRYLTFSVGGRQWEDFFKRIPTLKPHFQIIKNVWMSSKLKYKWGDPRVVIASNSKSKKYMNNQVNLYQFSLLNMFSTGVRLLASTYSSDTYRKLNYVGLNEKEIEQFVHDFRSVLIELNILPPDAKKVGKKMFTEANLFTLSSNGVQEPLHKNIEKNLVNFTEGIELVAMLYSSSVINKEIYKNFISQCSIGPKDIFEKDMVTTHCFWKNIVKYFSPQFYNIPEVQRFLFGLENNFDKKIREENWNLFEESIDKLIRYDWESDQWTGFIHLGKTVMLLHYIQSTLVKFDTDEDGILNGNESMAAFPHFRGLLKKMAIERCKNLNEEELKLVFSFIIKHAKVPKGSIEDVWDYFWEDEVDKVDHLHLLKIFRQILVESNNEGSLPGVCKAIRFDSVSIIMERAQKGSVLQNKTQKKIYKPSIR
jgi:hypothetical protein